MIKNGVYVVGDIHGRFDEWIEIKTRIENEDPDAAFIFVGDIEDRGLKSVEMIKWAMEHVTENGKYQMVKGNHEDGKVEWWNRVKTYAKYDNIDLEVTDYTQISGETYGFHNYMWWQGVNSNEMEKIINWMDNLPYYKDIVVNNKRFIITHADAPNDIFDKYGKIKEKLTRRNKQEIIWNREEYRFNYPEDTILVHGHTPSTFVEAFPLNYEVTEKDFGKIVKMENRFNVDCGAGYIGHLFGANLAILRLNDFKEYYLYNNEEINNKAIMK